MKTVYCSGALFCPEEVSAMTEISRVLEGAGYKAFLPHRDGVEAFVLNSVNNPVANLAVFRPVARFISRATFALDISKILDCDCFVFNLNGRVPDEGGVVETGVAFATGKPVVIYREDRRDHDGPAHNPVLAGAACGFRTVASIDEIPAVLDAAVSLLDSLGTGRNAVSEAPFMQEVASFGRKVDAVLRRVPFLKPANMMSTR
jgi:nucleoside 2-deoxyribosyltransferase